MELLAVGIKCAKVGLTLEYLRNPVNFTFLKAIIGLGDPAKQVIGKTLQGFLKDALSVLLITDQLVGNFQVVVVLRQVGVLLDQFQQMRDGYF